jgi:hypothetical protein
VLYQLSYLGTRTRCKEVALLQNWPEKIKVPPANSVGFYPVASRNREGPGSSEGAYTQGHLLRLFDSLYEKAVGTSKIGLAEREGFEPSVEVLAPTTV